MHNRGRTAIQQSKRKKPKVYFGECWTTQTKHWRDERSEIGLKHLQDVGDAPNTPKTTTKPKTQEEETTKSTKESAIIERRKADPKRIFDRKPQNHRRNTMQNYSNHLQLQSRQNPKIRRRTLSGIKTEFTRKFFNAGS